MYFRTDLAIEATECLTENVKGVISNQTEICNTKITHITVQGEEGEKALNRPSGTYVTIEVPPFTDHVNDGNDQLRIVTKEVKDLLPSDGLILVAGLGNTEITPDGFGPLTAQKILATRHIGGEIARSSGLDGLRKVAVIAPGVLGQTGMETTELLRGIVKEIAPAAVIVVDALASRKLGRLGCTIQLSDTGISPGAGVGNHRPAINKEVLGVPVIAVGVPTVVDAATLAADLVSPEDEHDADVIRQMVAPRGEAMMVTPREIDLLVQRAARMVSTAINCALQPALTPEELGALVS